MNSIKNNIVRIGCGLLFFMLSHLRALAGEYPMLHYTKDNGLPSNTIYTVYKDSRGFIWFATSKGVARYNGISFEIFNSGDGLPDNEIFSFQEDYRHRIWLATYSGTLCYYENGFFHNPENTLFLRVPLKLEHPLRINLEKDSTITICYRNLSYFINIQEDSCRIYQRGKAKGKETLLMNIDKISDSVYCVINRDETCQLNVYTDAIIYRIFHQKIFCSTFQNQKYFFDTGFIYNENYKKIYPIPASLQKSSVNIHRIYFDGKNYLIATDDGMYINNELMLLKGKRVTSATQDIAGNYWMSTIGDGVYNINKDFRKNGVIRNAYKGVVTYACDYNGKEYFATNDRQLYEAKNGTIKTILDFSKGAEKIRNQGNHIDCSINNNILYCLSSSGNIFTYDILKGRTQKFILPKEQREGIIRDRWKSIIATYVGLNIVSTWYSNFIPYTSFNNGPSVRQIFCTTFYSRIFAATSDNKSILHSQRNGIYASSGSDATLQPQYGKRLFVWLKYWNDKLIGCTSTNGLYVFSTEGKNTITDSFLSGKVLWNNAYPLSSDKLLLSSDKHYYILPLVNIHKNTILPKPVENPFLPTDAEYFLSDKNHCYFFKNGDITIVAKEDLLKDVPKPAIYFNKVVVGDSIFRLSDNDSTLILPDKYFAKARINFDVLAFNAVDVINEYCIAQDGNKPSDWELLTNKELNIVLPRYGTIKIYARVRTQGGTSSEAKQFIIVISKPWWARWWGIGLIVLASIVITGLLFYFFIQRALKRKEREHSAEIKVLNAEFKSLNAMMNPHFIFNTLNNIQGFINADNKLQANEYIRTFSDMIRQNMLNISKELVTLEEEMKIVESYLRLQCLRFSNISYDIDIDPAADLDEIMIPPLLIQPLVENSIKHGILPLNNKEGRISIKITGNNETARIEITDNGIGISKSRGRESSFALGALRKRIDALSITHHIDISFEIGDYTDASHANGTRVLLTISYRS
ncbi:hypothetical protein F0919_09625 [Taibaiella lutea]|uniref:Uncharacterized protein n=1 Tax=Taibaiella lutea TaxID=2608001 RepID=A0A5M6CLI2_9BACT|nr:histidine kinase [Taibaiella lutea]KAA5534852.1 hypothetical protein F0919_09625 [Taibaiella lutea]